MELKQNVVQVEDDCEARREAHWDRMRDPQTVQKLDGPCQFVTPSVPPDVHPAVAAEAIRVSLATAAWLDSVGDGPGAAEERRWAAAYARNARIPERDNMHYPSGLWLDVPGVYILPDPRAYSDSRATRPDRPVARETRQSEASTVP